MNCEGFQELLKNKFIKAEFTEGQFGQEENNFVLTSPYTTVKNVNYRKHVLRIPQQRMALLL